MPIYTYASNVDPANLSKELRVVGTRVPLGRAVVLDPSQAAALSSRVVLELDPGATPVNPPSALEAELDELQARTVPSAVYTATLQGVTSDSASDVVVEWSAAPTYAPDTFDLTPEQSIRVKRSGVFRISFFGEIGSMSNDDFWGLRVDEDYGDYMDLRSWAWTSFDRLAGDNHKRGAAMHLEVVFAVPGEAVLPVVLDFSVQSSPPEALATTYLTAFPQRLGEAPDLSGDGYYLPA